MKLGDQFEVTGNEAYTGQNEVEDEMKIQGLYPDRAMVGCSTISAIQFSSVQFSRSVMSDSLRPHELQHARPPCPSPTPRVHSDSRPSSR